MCDDEVYAYAEIDHLHREISELKDEIIELEQTIRKMAYDQCGCLGGVGSQV